MKLTTVKVKVDKNSDADRLVPLASQFLMTERGKYADDRGGDGAKEPKKAAAAKSDITHLLK